MPALNINRSSFLSQSTAASDRRTWMNSWISNSLARNELGSVSLGLAWKVTNIGKELPPWISFISRATLVFALQPARALSAPGAERRRRLFPSLAVEHPDLEPRAREAQAEIGVLGHVVRVPASEPFEDRAREMVGGAAERDRQPEPL